jgi:hypothetical protein|eukprot:gene42960-53303_t
MDFLGLLVKFPSKRPLNEQERAHHLKQKQRLNLNPHYQLSVIKLNSTYLESVDKWFGWKGLLSVLAIVIFCIFAATLGFGAALWLLEAAGVLPSTEDPMFLLGNGLAMAAVVACIGWGTWWLLKKESFAYTHYPMRFNRKTRMVHVFRPGGTVLSVPWDEVFFTLGHMPQWNEWEVRGHVIEADRTTVRESFALSYLGSMSPADAELGRTHFSDQDFVRAHWEFVRRFMEEGPQAVSSQVQFCMPVSGRRELARVSMERAFANIAGANIVLYWMLFPFCLAVGLGRVLAVRTSKIPRWPADVEASCVIESNDPYAIEGDARGERVAVFPGAARAAGVMFTPKPAEAKQAAEPQKQSTRAASYKRRR